LKISQYGIELRSMQASDLEMVRLWRNSDQVRTNMQYQKIISKEEQNNWFNAVDPQLSMYLIIRYGGTPVGVCNVRDIDWNGSLGEGGVFIGEKKYLRTTIPVRAILCATDYFCNLLRIQHINVKIIKQNTISVRFNKMLGAVQCGAENDVVSMYFTQNMFNEKTEKLRSKIRLRYGTEQATMNVMPETNAEKEFLLSRMRECSEDYLKTVQVIV
jgi:RimJ/RimL family protein N-acetyltransferase